MTQTPIHSSAVRAWQHAMEECRLRGTTYYDQDGRLCHEISPALLAVSFPTDAEALVTALGRCAPFLYPSPAELTAQLFTRERTAPHSAYEPLFGSGNQIDGYIIPLLRNHPETRRAVVSVIDPTSHLVLNAQSFPSLLSLQWRRGDTLSVLAHYRSIDATLGLPANIYQIAALLSYVAERLRLVPGTITILAASLHVVANGDLPEEALPRVARLLQAQPEAVHR